MVVLSRGLGCFLAFMICHVGGARIARRHGQANLGVKATCGVKRGSPDTMSDVNMSIVNGRPAAECAWPWQVHLGGCGGTLIHPQWVLSAAHCSTPSEACAGMNDRTEPGQCRSIAERIDHPQYTGRDHDMVLYRLSSPFSLNECLSPACLPSTKPQEGDQDFWITGWGSTLAGLPMTTTLQEAKVAYVSCSGTSGTAADVCIRGARYETACSGDSGGPLVKQTNGWWTVYGATSRGSANCGWTTVYTGVFDAMSWITSHIGGQSTPAPTPPPAPTPASTPPPSPTPAPPSPGGTCIHEKDCDVSPWCADSSYEAWCNVQGAAGYCPAPQCTRA